ncbi:glycosyltransferase [Paenibacillus sp. y28]
MLQLHGMNLIGFPRAEMGLGESCRQIARGLQSAQVPFGLIHVHEGNPGRMEDTSWAHKEIMHPQYGTNLFVFNPDMMPYAVKQLGPEVFQGRYNIGYWHWELPEFPAQFYSGFEVLQEIWVPSNFVLDSVSRCSPVPVVRIPTPVFVDTSVPFTRSFFSLPDHTFLFLTMYDMRSQQARKNPMGAVAAFQKAYSASDKSAGLVVKVNGIDHAPQEREKLKQQIEGWPNIYLIEKTLSRAEVNGLLQVCDSVVSLHRSEGFGLPLAEGMFLGKPVIGTDWSSTRDFMDQMNSCPVHYNRVQVGQDIGPYEAHQMWANPDIEHAAYYMRRLLQDDGWRKQIAAKGQETIRINYSPEACGRIAVNRLKRIGVIA